MAGDDDPQLGPADAVERGLVRRLRVIAILVMLGLIIFLVIVSPFMHVSELIVGSLLGTLLVLLGFAVKGKLPFMT